MSRAGKGWNAVLVLAAGLILAAPALAQTNSDCLDCHSDPDLAQDLGTPAATNLEGFDKSIHGQSGLGCTDCHADLAGTKEWPHLSPLAQVECANCHSDSDEEYKTGIHGQARANGAAHHTASDAANCASCHGDHDILPPSDPASKTFRLNIPATCGKCHLDPAIAGKNASGDVGKVESYFNSIHGWALAKAGLTVSAVCTDCHGNHDIHRTDDPQSKVAKKNIPQTCSQCHLGVYETYLTSVHGRDFEAGNPDVPVCTDCHSEHRIQVVSDPTSDVHPTNVSMTCSHCHEDEKLGLKYRMPAGRLKSYQASFHGISNKLGDVTVANCASCHGYHDILPSSDPRSPVHAANISKTCGSCHPQGEAGWNVGSIHQAQAKETHIVPYLVERFYWLMIVGVLGFLLAFIATDLYFRLVVQKRRAAHRPAAPHGSASPGGEGG